MTGVPSALVTGAASGIGKALAAELLARGFHVVAVDRAEMSAPALRGPADARFDPVVADLGEAGAVERLVARLRGFPSFDLVAHSAGVSATGRFEDIPAEAYRRLVAVNVEAPLALSSALVRDGRLSRDSCLVFLSSLSHATGYPGAAVYAGTKDAVAVYAKSVRKAYAARGVHVLTVFPPPVRTPHAARHAPPGASEARRMPPGRLAFLILAAAERRRNVLYPGLSAKLARIAGWLAPGLVTWAMRRALFERLDRAVW